MPCSRGLEKSENDSMSRPWRTSSYRDRELRAGLIEGKKSVFQIVESPNGHSPRVREGFRIEGGQRTITFRLLRPPPLNARLRDEIVAIAQTAFETARHSRVTHRSICASDELDRLTVPRSEREPGFLPTVPSGRARFWTAPFARS